MHTYVTGGLIRQLREKKGITQMQLGTRIGVTDKTVSKWETGRGLPDVSLLMPLAEALGISVPELLAGESVENRNRSGNMRRSCLYVCPVCGNVIHAMGSASMSCCGIALPPLEAEAPDEAHGLRVYLDGDEIIAEMDHEMKKCHYISFLAYVTTDRFELVKLYPEGDCRARFFRRGTGVVYAYCSHHGLFWEKLGKM